MARHPADDARVMTVAAQCQIGRMAVGEERRATLHIGFHESFNGRSGIVLDRGEADAAGARVEIFRVFAARLGLVGIAINHLNCADDEDLADKPRSKKASPSRREFPLDRSRRRLREARDPGRSSTAAASEPAATRFCKSPELILQLPRRHAVGMRRHQMRRPNHVVSGSYKSCITVHRGRSLSPAIEAF